MARYVHELKLLYEPNSTFKAIHDYLISEKFEYLNFEGEMVFKKGDGWVMAPTFIKVTFGQEIVRVESWIKYAILPGVFAGELGWDGFVGCAGKGTMKRCTRQIESMLGNVSVSAPGDYTPGKTMPAPAPNYAPAPAPAYTQPAAPTPVYAAAPEPTPAPTDAQTAAPKFCPGCGNPTTAGNRFCAVCGQQLF